MSLSSGQKKFLIAVFLTVIVLIVAIVVLAVLYDKSSKSNGVSGSTPSSSKPISSNPSSTTPSSTTPSSTTPSSTTPSSTTPSSTTPSSTTPSTNTSGATSSGTTPSVVLSCQSISDAFNASPSDISNLTDANVKSYWTTNACKTLPAKSMTCQLVSDSFSVSFKDANPSIPDQASLAFWKANSCQTIPSSQFSCQNISETYNAYPNNTTSLAKSPDAYNFWKSNACKTIPQSMLSCQNISDIYGAYPSNLAAATDVPNAAQFWNASNCKTITGYTSCQDVSDRNGTTWNRTYGTATDVGSTPGLKQYWDLNLCNTIPTSQQNNCQLMSDLWDAYPGNTDVIKEPHQKDWFVNKGCKTASGITSCQALSNQYNMSNVNGVVTYNSSPSDKALSYWKANTCDTRPQVIGQYVNFIRKSNQQAMAIREIHVFSSLANGAANIAAGKPVKMSSVNVNYVGANATDNNFNTMAWTSDKDDPTFIQVDLQSSQVIAAIEVFNRIDYGTRRNNGNVIQVLDSTGKVVYESDPVRDAQDSTTWYAFDDTPAVLVASWQVLPPSVIATPIALGYQYTPIPGYTPVSFIAIPIKSIVDLQNPSGTGYQQSNVKNLYDNKYAISSNFANEYNFTLPAIRNKLQLSLTLDKPSEVWYIMYYYHIDADLYHLPASIEVYNGTYTSQDLQNNTTYIQKTVFDNSSTQAKSKSMGWYVVPLTKILTNCSVLTLQVTSVSQFENWPIEIQVFGYEI